VQAAAAELGGRRRRGQGLETDLLRIVAGIERQLVARACGFRQTRENDQRAPQDPERPPRGPSPPPGGEGRDGAQALSVGQVLSIQVYVEVGSPFGQPGGAVMLRIGIVMIRVGSRIWKG